MADNELPPPPPSLTAALATAATPKVSAVAAGAAGAAGVSGSGGGGGGGGGAGSLSGSPDAASAAAPDDGYLSDFSAPAQAGYLSETTTDDDDDGGGGGGEEDGNLVANQSGEGARERRQQRRRRRRQRRSHDEAVVEQRVAAAQAAQQQQQPTAAATEEARAAQASQVTPGAVTASKGDEERATDPRGPAAAARDVGDHDDGLLLSDSGSEGSEELSSSSSSSSSSPPPPPPPAALLGSVNGDSLGQPFGRRRRPASESGRRLLQHYAIWRSAAGVDGGPWRAAELFTRFAVRGFAIGYGGQLLLALLRLLLAGRRGKKQVGGVLGLLWNFDRVRFGAALGCMLGTFRGALALLRQRRLRQLKRDQAAMKMERQRLWTANGRHNPATSTSALADPLLARPPRYYHPAVVTSADGVELTPDVVSRLAHNDRRDRALAGALAGLAIVIEPASSRQTVALYVAVRAFDALRAALERKGLIPTFDRAKVNAFLFGLANMPIAFGFIQDPSVLDKGYYTWIKWMGGFESDALLDRGLRMNIPAGAPASLRGVFYDKWVATSLARDWVACFLRALRVYVPVHLVPLVIFKARSMLDPATAGPRAVSGIAHSAAFLASYVAIIKFSCIVLVEGRLPLVPSGNATWKALLPGLLTGFSTILETPSRTNELMLYCVPRAWLVIAELLRRRGWKPVPHAEVAVMSLSLAAILGIDAADLKPLFAALLRGLVGVY